MLPLPLGLRLHYRRRDELVVGRRRRAHPSPAHGFANRAKSGNAVPTSESECLVDGAQGAEVPKMVCRLHGIGMERGLGPSGRLVRSLLGLIPAPCHPLKRDASASSASTRTRHGSSPAARADPTRPCTRWLSHRESSGSAVAPRHPGAMAVPDVRARLQGGRCDRGLKEAWWARACDQTEESGARRFVGRKSIRRR